MAIDEYEYMLEQDEVTSLADDDAFLVTINTPLGSAYIKWGSIKTLLNAIYQPISAFLTTLAGMTLSGNGTKLGTTSGTLTQSKQLAFDANGNITASAYDVGAAGSGGGDTIRTKYIISPSVTSNNLTVAIKYIDGNDCTSTNKLTFRVGNTEYDLTAAVSYTKNAATNWHNAGSAELATKDIDYFMYAIGETGASAGLKFGHSRIPYAVTMGDFVNTTTSEKYISGNWTNFNSTDPVTLIGRFRARLSAGAGYTWSIPTVKVVNYPIYETDWLTWQPAPDANLTSITISRARYQVSGRTVHFSARVGGTSANSTTSHSLTLPFDANDSANSMVPAFQLWSDQGGSGFGGGYVTGGTPDNITLIKYNTSAYANGVSCFLNPQGFYEIE